MPLTVHFLNVNRGDCSIIEFPSGHVGMIDICDVGLLDPDTRRELVASLEASDRVAVLLSEDRMATEDRLARKVAAPTTDPVTYFLERFRYRGLFRLIITHPHMDHLSGIHRLCNEVTPSNFWYAGRDNFGLDESDWSKGPYSQIDWLRYKVLRLTDESPKALVKRRGAQGSYWTEDGVEVLAPTDDVVAKAVEKNDPNILSQVLRINYRGWSFIFGGDADSEESWPDIYYSHDLSGRVVLKASHHGRNSGYHQPSVKEMAPWLTITSVGERKHDATEKYRQYSDYTVSLRFSGTISMTVDDDGTLRYPPSLASHWRPKRT